MKTTVALTDDHVLLRNGLAGLISDLGYEVVFQADNGTDMVLKLGEVSAPDIMLLDINMPGMDGYEAAAWLRRNHPDVKVLALSMYDDENSILRMIRNGANGYILKDSEPSELRAALDAIDRRGYYHSELVTGMLIHTHSQHRSSESDGGLSVFKLSDKELEFLRFAATELTYKEIAERMFISPRTVDGYRDALFDKLKTKSRVGLVLFGIRHGIVKV